MLNENQEVKCLYDEVQELFRIRRLYDVRINEQITRVKKDIEDKAILIKIGEHKSITYYQNKGIIYHFSERYSN